MSTTIELKQVNGAHKVSSNEPVVIIGTGDFGRALATRLLRFGIPVLFGSRDPDTVDCGIIPDGVQVLSNKDAVIRGNVIFLAIHRESYDVTVRNLQSMLDGKIVIDVNNPERKKYKESSAEYLSQIVPGARVVKAFNVISAWALESDSFGGSKQVPLCANDAEARRTVYQLARDIGFEPIDRGSLKLADELESIPHRFFPTWKNPVLFSFALFALIVCWEFVRRSIKYDGKLKIKWEHFPVSKLNIYFGFTGIGLLYLAYLPGSIAAILQLINGTKRKRFPKWLDEWMKARKQLGIMGFFFGSLHAVMVLLIMNTAFSGSFYEDFGHFKVGNKTIHVPARLNLNGELSMFFGFIALFLLCVLAVCSLPSVINTMSWREWNFAQSGIGHVMLACVVSHIGTMGTFSLIRHGWKFPTGYVPSVFYIELIFGIAIILLRLLLYLPCVYIPLRRIRHGWERSAKTPQHQDIKL